MTTIEVLRVNAIELAHAFRQIRFRHIYNEMVMVVHQHIRVNVPTKSRHHTFKHVEKNGTVLIIEKDVTFGDSLAGYVIVRPGEFNTYWSRHE